MKIENVKIVNYDETINNADVIIENCVIKSIERKDGESNRVLVPGFVDEHIHGFAGKDVMGGTEALEHVSLELAKHGTTHFLPTWITNTPKVITETLQQANKARDVGAKIVGYHIEGPFLSVAKKGAHNPDQIIKATKEVIEEFIEASDNRIIKMVVAPENFPKELIPMLTEKNIIVSVGHSNASAAEAKDYIGAGVTSICHLWNAMSGVKNREPGIATEALINDGVYAEMIFDLVHVDAKTIDLTIAAKGVEGIVAITDAIMPAGLPDGESVSGGMPVVKEGAVIKIKGTDTIAGSGGSMHLNFKNMIKLGYSLESAVAMTSYNSSLNLGLDKSGQVKEGFEANLVLMNDKLEIENVFIDGKEI